MSAFLSIFSSCDVSSEGAYCQEAFRNQLFLHFFVERSRRDCRFFLADSPWSVFSVLFLPASRQEFWGWAPPMDFVDLHGLQHTRFPCPLPTPRACSNSCPLSQWCHPTISSSVIPSSSCLLSFPASGYFAMSQSFASGGQILEFQLQHQSFQWIFRVDFL